MILQDVIDFSLLSRYDGKVKNWVLTLVPTADVLYTADDPEVISGEKQIGDVKIPGHNGLISKAQLDKIVNLGLKIKKSSAVPVSIEINADGTYTIDVSDKADKIIGGVENNFTSIDATGNIKDSGKNETDFATDIQGGYADSALQSVSPGTSGSHVTVNIGEKTGSNGEKNQTIAVIVAPKNIEQATSVDDGFALASDVKEYVSTRVAAAVNMRGSVKRYSELPVSPLAGDMYNVEEDETVSDTFYPGDMNYVWIAAREAIYYTQEEADSYNQEHSLNPGDEDYKTTNSIKVPAISARWDPQSPTVKITPATNSQIDSLFN